MQDARPVHVLAHHLAAVVEARGRGRGEAGNVGGARGVDPGEPPLVVQVAVVGPAGIGVVADDLAPIVDVGGGGDGGGRVVGGIGVSFTVTVPARASSAAGSTGAQDIGLIGGGVPGMPPPSRDGVIWYESVASRDAGGCHAR